MSVRWDCHSFWISLLGQCQHTCVKWIVSSRNLYDIDQRLGLNSHTRLSLELNADHISHAVDVYVDYKLSQLVSLRNDKALQDQVRDQMHHKSDGIFLWVALIFEELRGALRRNVAQVLNRILKGLTPLYDRMIEQIQQLEYDYPQLCLLTLATAALAHRPLHMLEIRLLAGLEEKIPSLEDLERVINICGSFLTIRDNYVYFIHQSYLTVNASGIIFPAGCGRIHYDIFSRSLDALSKTLRRDMYNLQDPGSMVENVPDPDPGPLGPIKYSCLFWVDHPCKADDQSLVDHMSDDGIIFTFLREHFLTGLRV